VIPAYNEERYLTQTLASLQNQDFSNFEIIVVDNNSTDSTAAIARSWGARVISQPQPGVAKTRQAGFYAARGTIIVTTDADTIFPEDWLSRIVYLFKIHPEAVAVGGLYNLYSGSLFARLFFRYIAFWFWKIDRWRMGNWSLPGCNLAVRATSFYKIGGFNTYLNVMEDAELCQRLKHIGTILFDPKLRVATSGRAYRNGLIIGLWRYIPRILHWEFSKQGKNNPLPVVRDEGPALLLILTSLIIAVLLLANFYSFQNAGLAEARQDLNEKCQHLITFVKPTHIINTWKNMQVHLP
jgi:glycosyltransferase involved in cell wall biosynthesis